MESLDSHFEYFLKHSVNGSHKPPEVEQLMRSCFYAGAIIGSAMARADEQEGLMKIVESYTNDIRPNI